MKKSIGEIIVVLSTISFTLLFYRQALGINVFIFEAAIIGWLFFLQRSKLATLK